MMKVYVATGVNWILPGLGWIILGRRPALGAGMILGAIGLTYVEFGIQVAAPSYYAPMFASVLLINTMLAIDCYLDGAAKFAATPPAAAPAA